ncbi:hypothetical protein EB796_022947 [Bugula neritina]|uniref:Uncharacterized protein n=1 Tax=Bugula neritina TaxID=10212 RepID=A0A7J7IZU9_BUGNE|nr:hypothetical protein EB796_022947 [Bugula neritina]
MYLEAEDTSPCFGSQVSSDILMQMWAMKYSEAEPGRAWSAHREIFGNQEEIEAVFPRLDELETDMLRAAMLATYGRFCEISNRHQEAIQKYQQVLTYKTEANSCCWYFRMAHQGIRRIR